MWSVERKPAGFWLRYAAWSLDAACLLPLLLLLGKPIIDAALEQAKASMQVLELAMAQQLDNATAEQSPLAMTLSLLSDPRTHAGVERLSTALTHLVLLPPLLYAGLACLWSVGFECSGWQATPGKRVFGLIVTDRNGQGLQPLQALVRFVAAGLSWVTLNLGHALVLFAPHLALHDRLSQTRVLVESGNGALPSWGRAWLLVQGLAALAGTAWLFIAMRDWMQGLLAQTLSGI